MSAQAAGLSLADIEDLAAHYRRAAGRFALMSAAARLLHFGKIATKRLFVFAALLTVFAARRRAALWAQQSPAFAAFASGWKDLPRDRWTNSAAFTRSSSAIMSRMWKAAISSNRRFEEWSAVWILTRFI